MFDIGWSELLVIAVVLIVVVGPKDLPPMLRAFGKMTQRARRVAGEFRAQFDEALREADLDEVRQTLSDAQKLNPVNSLREAMNPLRQMGQELKADLARAATLEQRAKAEDAAEATAEASLLEDKAAVSLDLPELSPDAPSTSAPAASAPSTSAPVASTPAVLPVPSAAPASAAPANAAPATPLPASRAPVVSEAAGLPVVAEAGAAPQKRRRAAAALSEDTEAALAVEGAKPKRRSAARKTADAAPAEAVPATVKKKPAPKRSASAKKDEA